MKLVNFAKDPCRTKETIKVLKDDDVVECESDGDKSHVLVSRNLFIADQDRMVVRDDGGVTESIKKLEGKV